MFANWRRFLLFQAWVIWQGGFVFYAAVVIPTATDIVGSPAIQGFVTREVTRSLNVLGAVFHLLMAWTLIAERGMPRWRWRVALSSLSAAMLIALFALHPVLDSFLDPVEQTVERPKEFYRWHVTYLWISTTQWVLGLANAWVMLKAWRGDSHY